MTDVSVVPDVPDASRLPHHHYTLQDMQLFIQLVLQGGTAFRCAGRVPQIVSEVCAVPLGQPNWTTGRLWLLRLGLYKLTQPKPRADDWAWLIDHSVQAGKTKCLLVLGIRLCELPPVGEPLRHADLEPMALVPTEQSTKEIVCEQLEDLAAKTGVPRVIVDDHGADLHGGVKLFQQQHPETSEIYDATHKAARLLKRRLERDPQWAAFVRHVGQARREVKQTELASLAPPSIGEKARFMNLGDLIGWGESTLGLLDKPPAVLCKHTSPERLEEKLGWLREFASALRIWSQFLVCIETTLEFVREDGLTPHAGAALRERLDALRLDPPARKLTIELAAFVRDDAAKAAPGERLPGSTEVLESCFGKFKALEQHQSRGGFTSLILSLGALVSRNTADVIQQALTTIRTNDVWNWCKNHLGASVQSLKKLVYHPAQKSARTAH